MYYLTMTSPNKNGKRHIKEKGYDLEALKSGWDKYNKKYRVEIYTNQWELVARREK